MSVTEAVALLENEGTKSVEIEASGSADLVVMPPVIDGDNVAGMFGIGLR